MKKNLFYLFALICSMTLFTACSDDDDDTPKTMATSEIAASYTGTLNVAIAGMPFANESDVPVSVTADADGSTVTINLSYDFMGIPLDINVPCQTVATETEIALSGNANVDLSGEELATNVTGTADGTSLDLDITVQTEDLLGEGNIVTVDYVGTK